MLIKDNNGGPAFARAGFTSEQTESQEGMTLRDYFAAKALAGLLASEYWGSDSLDDGDLQDMARIAFKLADAMLKRS